MKKLLLALVLLAASAADATVTSYLTSTSYGCNGVQTAFSIPFAYLADDNFVVTTTSPSATLVLGAANDYTISPSGGSTSTGTLTLTAGAKCPNAATLHIQRVLTIDQRTPFRTQNKFFPAIHETAFDRLTMIAQQLNDGISVGSTSFGTVFANSPLLGTGVPSDHLRWDYSATGTWTGRQTFTVGAGPAIDAYVTASGVMAIRGTASYTGGSGAYFTGTGQCYIGNGSTLGTMSGFLLSGSSTGIYCLGAGNGSGYFEGTGSAKGVYAIGGETDNSRGIYATCKATNCYGGEFIGLGTGTGVNASSGSGPAVNASSTSGVGVKAASNATHGGLYMVPNAGTPSTPSTGEWYWPTNGLPTLYEGAAWVNVPPIYNIDSTSNAHYHFVVGTSTLVTGTKAITITGTGAPFTSNATYHCMASEVANTNVLKVTYTSGSSVTFTSSSGADTDNFHFICAGY